MALPDGIVEHVGGYPVHPAASAFPMSDDETLRGLADDIAANGLREPIVLVPYWPDAYEVIRSHGIEIEDGADFNAMDLGEELTAELSSPPLVLVDGRNRLAACELAGVEPTFVEHIPGDASGRDSSSSDWERFVWAWVVSKNLHRRHLSTGQRAAVAAKYVQYFEVEAKKRHSEAVAESNRSRGAGPCPANLQDMEPRVRDRSAESATKAAEMFNVSARSVASAKKVMEQDPEQFAKVEAGELAPSKAERIIKERSTPAPTPQQLLAAREAIIQKEAEKLIRKYSPEEITLLLHYLNIGKGD